MVAIKPSDIDRLIKSPANYDAYLIFGPDSGLVSERAKFLSQNLSAKAKRQGAETEQITLLNDDLSANPERLSIDLKTISMFGERKILRVTAGTALSVNNLETLLKETPFEADLIIEAGDLKKTAKLRKIFESGKTIAAIPCYTDSNAALHNLIQDVLSANKLVLSKETEQYLISRLGADRGLSRKEVEKLALYAMGKDQITIEDIDNILSDMSEIAMDQIIAQTLLGNPQIALNQLSRAISTGLNPAPIFLSLLRQLEQLHKGALSISNGATIDTVAKSQRPPLYFERRDNFIKQLNIWHEDHLSRAINKVQEVMGTARRRNNPTLEICELEQLLLSLGGFAKNKKR